MWQAINVNAGGAISFRGSQIRDGRQGLVFQNGYSTSSELTDNLFFFNSSALTASNVPNLTFSDFHGNQFLGSPNVVIPGGGFLQMLPPHQAMEPIYAMNFNNVAGSIGTVGVPNTLSFFSTALTVQNSVLTINNCDFINNRLQDWNGITTGIGIWPNNSTITIQNIFSNNASCRFINNNRGIRSDNTNGLVVKNAIFSNEHLADVEVLGSNNPWGLVDISNNTFNLTDIAQWAIFVQRPAQGGPVIRTRVQSNAINLPNPPNNVSLPTIFNANTVPITLPLALITLQARPGAFDQAVIANNTIAITYGEPPGGQSTVSITGIQVSGNGNGYQLSGNTISRLFPTAPVSNVINFGFGIHAETMPGVNNIIGPNNTITSTLFPGAGILRNSWFRCGIHSSASPNILVCKNDVDDADNDYHFRANSANMEFGRNKVRDGMNGLVTEGTIPNQNHRHNEWMPGSNWVTNTARQTNNAAFGTRPWHVNPTIPGFKPPANTWSPANHFNMPGQDNLALDGIFPCDNIFPPPNLTGEPPTGELAEKRATGQFSFGVMADAWDFDLMLLGNMLRYPNTFSGNTVAEQFYAQQMNSTIWKFANAGFKLEQASLLSSTDQQQLDQLAASIHFFSDSLVHLEIMEGQDTTSSNPNWQEAKASLLTQISNLAFQRNGLIIQINSAKLTGLQDAKNYISALPEAVGTEANNKTILRLEVKKLLSEDWTNNDSLQLRAVAYSCPDVDGNAVRLARIMLPEHMQFVTDEGADPFCGEFPAENRSSIRSPEIDVLLYPNPSDESIRVDFGKPFSGRIEVLNAEGKLFSFEVVHGLNAKDISTASYPSGLYFLRVQGMDSLPHALKFSVLH